MKYSKTLHKINTIVLRNIIFISFLCRSSDLKVKANLNMKSDWVFSDVEADNIYCVEKVKFVIICETSLKNSLSNWK